MKASVCLLTYNQEEYISQAIEGILQQKTNFNFELVIGEDHSSDGTERICKQYADKYPDIIRLKSNISNFGLLKNFVNTVASCEGKYIAYCEGDDYWTNSFKLQKQVEILESDPEISLVHTQYQNLFVKENRLEFVGRPDKISPCETRYGIESLIDLLNGNFVWTRPSTFCFRKQHIQYLIESDIELYTSEKYRTFDFQLLAELSVLGKLRMLNESTIVYRRFEESISSTNDIMKRLEYDISIYKTGFYLIRKYKISFETVRKFFDNLLGAILFYIFQYNKFGIDLDFLNKSVKRKLKLSHKILLAILNNRFIFRYFRFILLLWNRFR